MYWLNHSPAADNAADFGGIAGDSHQAAPAKPGVTLDADLADDEVISRILAEPRSHTDRPWVLSNMVTSIDGAASVDGLSHGLGGPADLTVFGALRATADVIVAGAQTVRAESYRLPRVPDGAKAAWRDEHAQYERPRLCIVTRQGTISEARRLLSELPDHPTDDPTRRPIIATVDEAPIVDDERFDVIRLGKASVDPMRLIDRLADLGAKRILCEGGPHLLGQFAAADLIDEWNFTVAPTVVSGDATRPVDAASEHLISLRLQRTLIHDDGTLLLRYVKASPARADAR